MLRISIIDSRTERRLVLEGKLIAPWVAELRTTWKTTKTELQGRALISIESGADPALLRTILESLRK